MPNWKKVIVSGSDASLNSLNVSAGITGSLFGTASWANNSVTASYFSGSISNAIYAETASYSLTASYATQAATASYYVETDPIFVAKSGSLATTGSNTFVGTQTIQGLTRITGTSTNELVRITQTGTGAALIVEDSTNPDTSPFVIDNSGDVGIGTSSPTRILHTTGSTNGTSVPLFEGMASSETRFLTIKRTDGTAEAFINYTGVDLAFGANSKERLRIGRYGDISIGTTSSAAGARLYLTGNDDGNIIRTTPLLIASASANTDLVRFTQTGTGNSFVVEDTNTPDSSQFVIDNVGNVGIGTTTPNSKLEVNGNTIITGSLTVTGSINSYDNITLLQNATYLQGKNSSNVTTRILGINSSNLLYIGSVDAAIGSIFFNINGSNLLQISSSGDVGLGKSNPNAKLDVNGNTIITGSLTITNDLIVFGSSSIQYITSSQLNIATNLINVNTNTPAIRFGGIAVNDSGSSPIRSGSIIFDSQENQWLFVHQDNAGVVTSSILLMGPETYGAVGSETHPTTNRILKSLNDEHVGDSNITDTGTLVSINSNTEITGSVLISGSLTVGGVIFGNGGMSMSGSNNITGSLIISGSPTALRVIGDNIVTGSLRVTGNITGSGLLITGNSGVGGNSVVAGNSTIGNSLTVNQYIPSPIGITVWGDSKAIYAINTNDGGGIGIDSIALGAGGETQAGDFIGGRFYGVAGNGGVGYSVQLQDGTQGIGKVLVSQTSDGKANWSTKLVGSYEITGSLTVSGSYNSPAGNTIDSNALIQASLLYLSNNF